MKTSESVPFGKLADLGLASVPRIGLGCMGMSEFYGSPDEQTSLQALSQAFELGYRHFDTADTYGRGHNERLLGMLLCSLGARRHDLLLATKVGFRRAPDGGPAFTIDSSPAYIRSACEASLARLGVERIGLLYLHRRNPEVPIEDSVGAMQQLVREGKVASLGLSEVSVETLRTACSVSPIAALQSEYSLWTRDLESKVLDECERLNVAVVAYSPLGRGFLSGALSRASFASDRSDMRNYLPRFQEVNFEANLRLVESLREVALAQGCSASQVALAWILAQHPFIHVIPGAKRPAHVCDNFRALDIRLSPEQVGHLSRTFAPAEVRGERYPPQVLRTVNT